MKGVFWIMGIISLFFTSLSLAKDIDIYDTNVKNNSYILMDNSGSMAWGVYDHNIDYGAMYDYLITLYDGSPPSSTYIWDSINEGAFYQNHKNRKKIFLWKAKLSLTIAQVNGKQVAFTGDSGNPDVVWTDLVDTNTVIDDYGNIADDGTGNQRLTVNALGQILFDNAPLPIGQGIKLHDFQTLYDGSMIDNGFGGLMKAPGSYFSGYEGVTAGSLDVADDGDAYIYFFVTGNWANMQDMYNLKYTTNNPVPNGASTGDMAWIYEKFPISADEWSQIDTAYVYPDVAGGDLTFDNDGVHYQANLTEDVTSKKIVHPGAQQIQVHFSSFDVNSTQDSTYICTKWWKGKCISGYWANDNPDWLKIYNENGDLVTSYNNDNPPPADGWSVTITGDTVDLKLSSGKNNQGTGYIVDSIRVTYSVDSYLMQSRMDVGKDAMLYTVEEFRSKMNWGFATFNYNGTTANGATIGPALNANDNDDTQREAIAQAVRNVQPMYGTPLGEALQDVFEDGYYGHRNSLEKLNCRKNYVIVVTDGFPSGDDSWSRILGKTFTDEDGDGWTADPSQYSNPPPNYYDDVARYLYTHSWMDHSVVPDPADSYVNVIPHQIAFGAKHPLLMDAAKEGGGEYITAYNKTQLIAAFHSLALMMSEAVSFTAPVVSVDAANKIQNGDDLYMGLFLPQDGSQWIGNIKKFVLGDGSVERPDIWKIYDGNNEEALDVFGAFKDNTAGFWDDDDDANDSDNYGAADVTEDGVGSVMLDTLKDNFNKAIYWERPIYTYLNGAMTKFHWNSISAAELGVADDAARDGLINYVYGYSNSADPATHEPVALRNWPMGSIIHSRPVVIDYYQSKDPTNLPDDISIIKKRYIVIGANDGMFHVFDDTPENVAHGISKGGGVEVFSFIPPDLLTKLKELPVEPLVEMVDGTTTLYRHNKQPKYVIFGERRGGAKYWCLNISDSNPGGWNVQWSFPNASNPIAYNEIAETWSDVMIATIPINVGIDGEHTFKDVIIFTAGYDNEEDNYPEPFEDLDNNGSPYPTNGTVISNKEWDKTDASQDINNNDVYDKYNPGMNEKGRGIFVVDIDNPENTFSTTIYNPDDLASAETVDVLPFSVTYGATDQATGNIQTRTDMKWCFPSSPSIIIGSYSHYRRTADGIIVRERKSNVLQRIYAPDIYSNIFKVDFNFNSTIEKASAGAPSADWKWKATELAWNVEKVFSGNPGSLSMSGAVRSGIDNSDKGRKMFYPPTVSWGGSCSFFDSGNYYFRDWKFKGTQKIATLFVGTGDREHPRYTMIRNRFYSIYDDSTVTAEKIIDPSTTAVVSTSPYDEDDLLNVTCNELGSGTATTDEGRDFLRTLLLDDATYDNSGTLVLENGSENDAKGWYIVLEDQGKCTNAGVLDNAEISGSDNHYGEKILGKPVLFAGIAYFTSYQPSAGDPCNPTGFGFIYALDYCDATAPYDLDPNNPKDTPQDRSRKLPPTPGILSPPTTVIRPPGAGLMFSAGGRLEGVLEGDFRVKDKTKGLQRYYWREGNSMQQ
jgi:type IV pilus assembly protein PilY1